MTRLSQKPVKEKYKLRTMGHFFSEDYTSSWTVAYENYQYFANKSFFSNHTPIMFESIESMEYALCHELHEIAPGDLLYFQWEYDHPHHAAIVDGVKNNTITYSAHTDPHFRKDIREFWNKN